MKLRVPARLLVVATVASTVAAVFSVTPAHASAPGTASVQTAGGASFTANDSTAQLSITIDSTSAGTPFVHPVVSWHDLSGHDGPDVQPDTSFNPAASPQTLTATLNFDDGNIPAAPGSVVIRICEVSCSGTVVNESDGSLTLTSGAPSTTGAPTPSSIGANAKKTVLITGANFARGASVAFQQNGSTVFAPTSAATHVLSATQISVDLDLTAAGAQTGDTFAGEPTGGYTVRVANTDTQHGGSAVLTLNPTPTMSLPMSLPDLGVNASNTPLTITGTNFVVSPATNAVPTVTVAKSAVPTYTVSVDSAQSTATSIVSTFSASGSPTAGDTDILTVTNPDGGYVATDVLIGAAPTLTQSAFALGRGASGRDITITGSGFQTVNDAVPTVDLGQGVTHNAATNVVGGSTSSLHLLGTSVASDAPTGTRNITITNPDGGHATTSDTPFTVTAAPSISGVGAAIAAGTGSQDVSLSGTGFQNGMQVVLTPAVGAPLSPITISSQSGGTSATLPVNTTSLAPGLYSLTPTNVDYGTSAAFHSLEVDSFLLQSVLPTAVNNGGSAVTTLTVSTESGSAFPSAGSGSAGYTLTLTADAANPGLPSKTSSVGALSASGASGNDTWTGDIDLTHVAPGVYDISISDDAGHSGTCACTFIVGQQHAPTIGASGVSPNAVAQNATQQTVTITGTGFTTGDTVVLQRGGTPVSGLSVSSVVASDFTDADGLGKQLTFTVTAAPSTVTGPLDVVVHESGGGPSSNICGGCFAVDQPPAVTSLDQTNVGQGATNYQIVVTGTNLPISSSGGSYVFVLAGTNTADPGMTVDSISGTSNSVTLGVSVASPSASPASTVGAHDLVVTNTADNGTTTKANALTIDAPPSPTGFAPASVRPSAQGVSVTVMGSGFVPGSLSSAAADFSTPTVDGSGNLIASANVHSDAVIGTAYDIVVTNADGGTATCVGCLFVAVPPTWGNEQAATMTPHDSALDVSWPAPADNGGSNPTSYEVTLQPHAGGTPTIFDGNTTSHTFTSLSNGALYDVSIVATNVAGNSQPLTGASGTPRTVPGTPTGVSAKAGDQSATISWTAPSSDGGNAISAYRITVSPGGSIANAAAGARTAIVSGLTNGTAYTFTVAAQNAAGFGAESAATSPVTPKFVTRLSIRTSASKVVYGHSVTLSGALTRSNGIGISGAHVGIYRRYDGGTTVHIATVTTGTGGAWHYTFNPVHNITGAALYSGDAADLAKASSNIRTLVASLIRLSSPLNGSTSSTSKALVVTGSVSPNKAGQTVKLYYLDSAGHVHLLASTKLSSKSQYRFSVKLRRGTWRLRVLIASVTANYAGSSQTIKVKRT